MTQLAYQTVNGVKHLLTKDGGLCTTCCALQPRILETWTIYPYHYDTKSPRFNLYSAGFWGDGVAVGYAKWRFYRKPGGYYPPYHSYEWINAGGIDRSSMEGGFQDFTFSVLVPINAGKEGDVTPEGRLKYLQYYLSSFSVQYSGGMPVQLPATVVLCVSPDGVNWPALP
jgi:hypothetical protein